MLLLKVPLVNGHHLLYAVYSRLLLGDFIVHYFSGAIADFVVVFFVKAVLKMIKLVSQ